MPIMSADRICRAARFLLLACAALTMSGCILNPNLSCPPLSVNLPPNACQTEEPFFCSDMPGGGMEPVTELDSAPVDGISLSLGTSSSSLTVCAGSTVVANQAIPYTAFNDTNVDALGNDQWGTGTVTVTVSGLAVTATASPATIAPGGTTTLTATATGGFGNYTYAWSPATVDSVSASTTALPTATTTYTIMVTDTNTTSTTTLTATAQVTVTVGAALSVTATAVPSSIYYDQGSVLQATVSGGTPPYSYLWTPNYDFAQVNGDMTANPLVYPQMTTTYTVKVTDSLGATAQASTTVTVMP